MRKHRERIAEIAPLGLPRATPTDSARVVQGAVAPSYTPERRPNLLLVSCSHSLVPMARVRLPVSTMTARLLGLSNSTARKQPRPIWLPAETLKFTGETVCASLNRTELCLALSKTSDQSFRAAFTALDFAYCDFTERGASPIRYRDQSLQSRCQLTHRVRGRSISAPLSTRRVSR